MRIRHLTLAFLLAGLAAACSAPPPRAATPDRPSAAASATSIDMRRLLPVPFATGSSEARAQLAQMLAIQASRTPASAGRARADADASVFRFADALGSPPAFTPERLPLVNALFARVLEAEGGAVAGAKDGFARIRPCRAEPRLEPVLPCPTNGSYPSGHSAFGWAAALVLAELVPERRAAILARAREFAWNRVVAGVHYPSDVEAGRVTGVVVAAFLFASPQFQAEERAARHELRAALGLPAEPANG